MFIKVGCLPEPQMAAKEIYVKVASLGGSSIPVEMLVKINNGGTNETILIDAAHDVFVNGGMVTVPHDVSPDIRIRMENQFKVVILEGCGKFGFWVNSPMSKGILQIDRDLFGLVDGLCGDFNGVKDDLRLRNGTLSDDFDEISDSYRSNVPNKK